MGTLDTITSTKNALVQRFASLAQDRSARRDEGLAVLEGVRLAEEALQSGAQLAHVLLCPERLIGARGDRLQRLLLAAGVPLSLATTAAMDKATDTVTPQGVAALFRPQQWTMADLVQRTKSGPIVVLDGLSDPGNLGTIIRSAEALGAAGLLLGPGTVDPYSPKVVRSAMGSLFRLPLVEVADLARALADLQAAGVTALAAEAGGASAPWEVDMKRPVALVIGNEAHGPKPATLAACQGRVRIPMPGPAESLNAAVAASLLLYEGLRQREG